MRVPTSIKFARFFLVIPAIMLFFAFSAQAQPGSQVTSQLEKLKDYLDGEGYSKTHNYLIDSIDEGDKDTSTVTLRKGWSYKITAVCDNDCPDIDVKVIDENDNVVSEDPDSSSLAIATVTPKWTGEFKIQVHMYSCLVDPCFYGIGIFGK